MATFKITSVVPSCVEGVPRRNLGVPVWFVTFDVTTSKGSVFPGHEYEFAALNAAALQAQCQAVADHDEAEELARVPADLSAPVAFDPLSVFAL